MLCANLFGQADFITVKNRRFYCGQKEFSFLGFNAYYLLEAAANKNRRYIVDEVFRSASQYNIKVIRTWAFNDGEDAGSESLIRWSPYGYNQRGLEALDYVLYAAGLYKIKLILTFNNNYSDYGGIPQYLKWYEKAFNTSVPSQTEFFVNDTLKKWYKSYISLLLERTNIYTGIKYKSDPTIFSFELINEGINTGQKPEAIANWYGEMASYFKSIDGNHLLASGEEGYDCYPELYSNADLFYNSAGYLFNGYKGTSYNDNSRVKGIDYCSFHLYPGLAGFSTSAGKTWIDDHNKIAAGVGKPVLSGELGVKDNKYTTYKFYFEELKKSGIKNCLVWQYLHKDVINNDGFGFNEFTSPALMEFFRSYALSIDSSGDSSETEGFETVLYQNYPNPFNPVTTIRYSLKTGCFVDLILYNSLGEQVGVIDAGYKKAGVYERVLSMQNSCLASGVYFYTLHSAGKTLTRKIILQK